MLIQSDYFIGLIVVFLAMSNIIEVTLITLLAALNCGLIGTFLMLRKQAMIGDAISHAVLPGIVVAFMLGQGAHPLYLSLGAIVAGLLAVFLISFLKNKTLLPHGAAIGIVFPFFFALGVVLLAIYVPAVDLDPACILYGDLVNAIINRLIWQGADLGPKAFYTLGGLLLCNVLFVALFYKKLFIASFDEGFANLVGVKSSWLNYALLGLTTINAVLLFEIVGVLLVIGFLIVPTATAYLFNKTLPGIFFYTAVIDCIISLYGYMLARSLEVSLPGSMMIVGGTIFIATFVLVKHSKKGKG